MSPVSRSASSARKRASASSKKTAKVAKKPVQKDAAKKTPARELAFPIGFWNYSPVAHHDATSVKDWKDAGMTLAMSPEFGDHPDDAKRIMRILDEAHRQGIRVILCHHDGYWRTLTQSGEDAYRTQFRKAVKQYGRHPALFGFHVGDEPGVKEFPDACKALRIQKELAPHLSPFCNLLPWYNGVDDRVGFSSWSEYLDAYVRDGKPDLLCYDCYAQMNPDPEESEWGYAMYFNNLREYSAAALRHGIPFWTTLLSVGHFRYRCPNEDHLRWQLNTALAHGAQGILYFFFYMRAPHDNYRVAPIDEHGERSETYEWLSRVNRTFLSWTAPIVRKLTLRQAWHTGRAWGGFAAPDGQGLIREASASTPLVVSEFADPEGRPYVMVVNNSQRESTQAKLTIHADKPLLYRVGWQATEAPILRGDGWQTAADADSATIRPWLAPGQMELYRVGQAT